MSDERKPFLEEARAMEPAPESLMQLRDVASQVYGISHLPKHSDHDDVVITTPEGNKLHRRISGCAELVGGLFAAENDAIAAVKALPAWIRRKQPDRTYQDEVSRIYAKDDTAICPHPSNILLGSKVIGRWFILRREGGGEYEFVSQSEWERLRPLVPIYGERIGDRMVIWDRIVDEHWPERGGYRENTVSDATLLASGYSASQKILPVEYGGWQSGKSHTEIFREVFDRAMVAENLRTKKAMENMVIVDEFGTISEEAWGTLNVAFDRGAKDGESWCIWSCGPDGRMLISEVGSTKTKPLALPMKATPEVTPPATKAATDAADEYLNGKLGPKTKIPFHNRGFFPSKIGRIASLPRYPGVWG